MKKRFEIFLYDGAGRGKSKYFDHLEDLLAVAEEFVGDDMEMTSQFNAYDHFKNRDISHNVGMYIMEGVESIDNDCYAQVESAKKNVEKSCGYKWEIDTDNWFFIDFTGVPYFSEEVFESKNTCYENMREVAFKLMSYIRVEDMPYVKVDFKDDAILIKFENGKDYAEYSFTMYESK